MAIITEISDLFFNRDLSEAEIYGRDGFEGWDKTKLEDAACELIQCLSCLGVTDLPTVNELVEDFFTRV